MAKINWGILGLGDIALKFADAFSNLDNAKIKGIASNSDKKLILFKEQFKVDQKYCFKNYQDLILCPEIDVIYIALPNSFHAKYINECAELNKHVLIEKPAFTNIDDFNNFKNKYKNVKCYFTEGFMYRHLPYFQYIKKIIQNKTLGDIKNINSNFKVRLFKERRIFGLKFKSPNYSNRLFNKSLGGGSILDLGCYPLSLSTFIDSILFKTNIKDIKLKSVNTEYCDSGVDIHSTLVLNFGEKFTSKVMCSFKEKMNQNTFINFTNGSINIEETWDPTNNQKILIINKSDKKKLEFKNNNIYSYQIKNISNQLLDNQISPIFPSINLDEIEKNTYLLDKWIKNNQGVNENKIL